LVPSPADAGKVNIETFFSFSMSSPADAGKVNTGTFFGFSMPSPADAGKVNTGTFFGFSMPPLTDISEVISADPLLIICKHTERKDRWSPSPFRAWPQPRASPAGSPQLTIQNHCKQIKEFS